MYFNGEGTAVRVHHQATKHFFQGINTSNKSDNNDNGDNSNNDEPMLQLSEATGRLLQNTVAALKGMTLLSRSTGFHKILSGGAGLGSFQDIWW